MWRQRFVEVQFHNSIQIAHSVQAHDRTNISSQIHGEYEIPILLRFCDFAILLLRFFLGFFADSWLALFQQCWAVILR